LSEEQEDEFKEAFKTYSPTGGNIPARDLGYVMRYLGQNPTLSELEDHISQFGSGGTISLDGFLRLMGKRFKDNAAEEEVMEAFKVFDKDGRGFISSAELRHIMTNLGDRLTEEEVDTMLNEAIAGEEGSLNYAEFVRMMLNR
jgi:calmodulin